MSENIQIAHAVHGSAKADGSAEVGRVTFRLSSTPERRWLELFKLVEAQGLTTEERGREFLLHVECAPGEVSAKRHTLQALIADVNGRWRAELNQQTTLARERNERKRSVEDALNLELDALSFDHP